MWLRVSDFELTENVWCDAIVEFRCTSRGYRGDFYTEGEGPEFEITYCYVDEAWGGHWEENGWKEVWCKSRHEMGDWVAILDKRLDQVLDTGDIYDRMCDQLSDFGDY